MTGTRPPTGGLVVERVGAQTLVVDRGRPGWAHIGVPTAGALDSPAHALAQRLVGNPPDAAGLEILLGGLAVRADGPATVAVTGPPTTVGVEAGPRRHRVRSVGTHGAVHLRDADVLVVDPPATGLRLYLAVSGGVDVTPVLGSRSADTLSGLGPDPLAVGTRLPVGPHPGPVPASGPVPVGPVADAVDLAVRLGPRDDWIADAAAALAGPTWTVAADADRVGVRFDTATDDLLRRAASADGVELRSEGLVLGALQVPPDGRPLVFLADHPTTGGYPVVGVVEPAGLPALAQARPGSSVRWRPL